MERELQTKIQHTKKENKASYEINALKQKGYIEESKASDCF